MLKINENFAKMARNYLFAEIANRVNRYQAEHPEEEIIRLGIGDVTRPLPKACVQAMKKAADEMGEAATFRGSGPDYGYDFLLQAIAKHDFQDHGVEISADEIFLSDGAKSDTSSIGDIFAVDNVVAVCDPVYPVYVDSNVMAGRAGEYVEGKGFSKIVYMPCKAENNFLPEIPQEKVDMIYLCFPNNPSSVSISQEELKSGSITPTRPALLSCTTRHTRHLSPLPGFPIRFSKWKGPKPVPSSSVPSVKRQDSPVPAVRLPLFPKSWSGAEFPSISCGPAASPRR